MRKLDSSIQRQDQLGQNQSEERSVHQYLQSNYQPACLDMTNGILYTLKRKLFTL